VDHVGEASEFSSTEGHQPLHDRLRHCRDQVGVRHLSGRPATGLQTLDQSFKRHWLVLRQRGRGLNAVNLGIGGSAPSVPAASWAIVRIATEGNVPIAPSSPTSAEIKTWLDRNGDA
jgi:hypothetical protein